MARARYCCNPLEKANYSCIRNNLILITAEREERFKNLLRLHIYSSCKRAIYKSRNVLTKSPPKKWVTPNSQPKSTDLVEPAEVEMDTDGNLKTDPPFVCICMRMLSKQKENVKTRVNKVLNGNNNNVGKVENNNQSHKFIENTKAGSAAQTTRSGKIRVLTTIPANWPMKKICHEFGVSRRIITCAKKLATKYGFAVGPPKRKGKKLSDSMREKVRKFYLSDEVS